jgi:hypothetical protein
MQTLKDNILGGRIEEQQEGILIIDSSEDISQ